MAKFRPILGELSGSIGANTFAHNRGGAYSRGRSSPTNPNSLRQQAARAALAQFASKWQALSGAQRQTWRDWAQQHPGTNPLGNTFLMSGEQAFVKLNSALIQANQPQILDPPITGMPAPLTSFTPTWAHPDQITLVFSPSPLLAGYIIQVWSTIPGSPGRNPNFNQARLVAYSGAAPATNAVVTSRLPGVAGQTANVFAVIMDVTGQRSPELAAHVVLT